MAQPRYCTVQIKVEGANSTIDVTNDLISFSIEDTTQRAKCDNMDIVLDDAGKRYRNTWFIEKGTKISATVTTHNWNEPGDSQSRDFGVMWVDTIEMTLKPSIVTIKATSISPALLKGEKMHKGTEGKTGDKQVKDDAEKAKLKFDTEGTESAGGADPQINTLQDITNYAKNKADGGPPPTAPPAPEK